MSVQDLGKTSTVIFYSDRRRISEIFRDLISNAIKYRKPDSLESEVMVKTQVDHPCADISFADNGIGINGSSLKRIFEMFGIPTNSAQLR